MSQLPASPPPGPAEGRWSRRPEGSTWGDFGADDVLGRLNLIGPDQVRKGLAEVHDGITFCLSLPLDRPGGTALSPNRFPPVVRPTLRSGTVNFNCDMSVAHPGATDVVNDDLVVLHTQYSTQWDAFGHVGARFDADGDGTPEPVYYNGWRAGSDVTGPATTDQAGASSLARLDGITHGTASTSNAGPVDISHMARHGVQGRAVLIDLAAHYGIQRTAIGYEQLAQIMDSDAVDVEAGDILLLHTGYARQLTSHGEPPREALNTCPVLDGGDPRLQAWIRDSQIAAIAADNHAVEAFPDPAARPGQPVLPLHRLCLFELGVHLGELWWLHDLAQHLRAAGRSRCLLTAPPLRLPRATGSPVTPIATV
ncbi:cyclase family protein [Streptomyces mutabilis]|uniref:Cyclase n=1 Tax=Streptomyces mutabilis TaxID=67332 RepID=A0A086MVG6_9ACTN|nr:cyclase family protein [Streptomyces mutabilis]KFG72884.1 cyclase [Streptomyces mutabilis]